MSIELIEKGVYNMCFRIFIFLSNEIFKKFLKTFCRQRYDFYRYAPYDNRAKGGSIQSGTANPFSSTTVSQHSGPAPLHMVQHGLHLTGPHLSNAPMVPQQQHLSQTHLIQDISEISANKRPRLTMPNESRAPIHQPLLIDTRDMVEVKKVINETI